MTGGGEEGEGLKWPKAPPAHTHKLKTLRFLFNVFFTDRTEFDNKKKKQREDSGFAGSNSTVWSVLRSELAHLVTTRAKISHDRTHFRP